MSLENKFLNSSSRIVQGMISRYPFTSWPLHVKLFTEEAVKYWDAAARKSKTPLPLGFICSVELEGVDGKSGLVGSGRVGPMRADDGKNSILIQDLADNNSLNR
jgi:structure-specific endonuclease subunit SLX1